MSEVKRYILGAQGNYSGLHEWPDGDYVLYTAFDALAKERDGLRVQLAAEVKNGADGDAYAESLNKIIQDMTDCGDCEKVRAIEKERDGLKAEVDRMREGLGVGVDKLDVILNRMEDPIGSVLVAATQKKLAALLHPSVNDNPEQKEKV